MTSTRTASSPGRAVAGHLGVALLAAVSWFAWMGWDTQYRTDPATGAVTGPYEAWQVVGCAVCLVVVTVLAARVLGAWRAAVTVALAFTVAWSLTQASTDESGLWLVGAALVLVGTGVGAAVVALVTVAVGRRRAARVPA
ncbi:hypothetical protein [Cellulomonas xiejunii]|uniref:hypothetical protein n=1 Tax=Cellulomonas xiejunii TaxID=2968083 RepID=UPI001D0DE83A|nr:hypothetical protein [Cellulomonas xiejunii]MCC2316151.1 hypothetical protein [Cellulomonas xiejunii]